MKNEDALKLSKERRVEIVEKIRAWFLRERDEELGDLAAGILLDFFIEALADDFYNQGVGAAHKYLNERLDDLLTLQKF